jgi:hypothetical protein
MSCAIIAKDKTGECIKKCFLEIQINFIGCMTLFVHLLMAYIPILISKKELK